VKTITPHRVAITGLGLICALGNSVDDAVTNAYAGVNRIVRLDKYMWGEYGEKIPIQVGGLVRDLDWTKYIPAKFVDRYDPEVVFALAAAQEALDDAGLEFDDELRDRTGVLIGTAVTGNQTWHRALHMAFAEKKAHEIPGFMIMQISGNMPAGLVALQHKFRGPNLGVINACATGGTTLSIAADYIRFGRAPVVVAGGTEAAIGLAMYGSLSGAGAINPTDDPSRASRPFSADRAGLVKGEGSGVMVLERYEEAVARGAKIYGEILGDSQTNDAYHIIAPEPTGKSWGRAITLALEAAEVAPEEIDYISAHATSTRAGDLSETRAIKFALGEHAKDVPVSATKSMHGHAFGATGAIEIVLALAAMQRDWVLPTINLDEPDPECDLDYVPNRGREQATNVLLKNSFGFGGTNSCVVIRKG
jgi:3-oxoacyl-[acyl-carrier-protein] synthase II